MIFFFFRNVVDLGQGDHVDAQLSHHVAESSQSTVEEESTAYRGYTNPNVQSRSFKILQQSLNYSEASGSVWLNIHGIYPICGDKVKMLGYIVKDPYHWSLDQFVKINERSFYFP